MLFSFLFIYNINKQILISIIIISIVGILYYINNISKVNINLKDKPNIENTYEERLLLKYRKSKTRQDLKKLYDDTSLSDENVIWF
jgi:hypothetical protein